MNEYLRSVFGDAIRETLCVFPQGTPNYIRNGYKASKIYWNGQECVLLRVVSDSFRLSTVKKQFLNFCRLTDRNCALSFYRLSSIQRKNLIADGIPFVADNSQIFLPFWGVALTENIKKQYAFPSLMSPGTQMVCLFLYYREETDRINMAEIASRIGTSKATCTRAIEELNSLHLIDVETEGTNKWINISLPKKEFIQKAFYYMKSPVSRTNFVKSLPANLKVIACGVRALSEISMVSAGNTDSGVAVYKKKADIFPEEVQISEEEFYDDGGYTVELWNYDPDIFAVSERVDDISLLLSLKDSKDERVQMGLDTIRKKHGLPIPEEE